MIRESHELGLQSNSQICARCRNLQTSGTFPMEMTASKNNKGHHCSSKQTLGNHILTSLILPSRESLGEHQSHKVLPATTTKAPHTRLEYFRMPQPAKVAQPSDTAQTEGWNSSPVGWRLRCLCVMLLSPEVTSRCRDSWLQSYLCLLLITTSTLTTILT